MTISFKLPELMPSGRKREWDAWDESVRDQVIYQYLFEGHSHRELDRYFIQIDPVYSRGYQSMGILHYLGINDQFKGIFSKMKIDESIRLLSESGDSYDQIKNALERYSVSSYDSETYSENDNLQSIIMNNIEGTKREYYTTRYERNPSNRRAAIKIHGLKCSACGFDFEKTYGELGKDFIEVHHVKPLHSLEEEVKINPQSDLACVCSNCHRMIHRQRDRVLAINELKIILQTVQAKEGN